MSIVTQVMRKNLQRVASTISIAEAAKHMRDKRIGSLLVEKSGEVVGIVTDTDIVRKGVAEGKDLLKVSLENIMTTPLVCIESVRSLQDAHDMMGDLGVRHLVVTEGGKIIGLISVRDLLAYFKSVSEPKITQD